MANIKIKCYDCNFEDLPENFSAVQAYEKGKDGWIRVISVCCPICDTAIFFTYFNVYDLQSEIKSNNFCMSFSHLVNPTLEEASTAEEAREIGMKKLKELKEKYGKK